MKRTIRNKIFSAWDVIWIQIDFCRSTYRSRLSLWFQGCSAGKGFITSGQCYFKSRCKGAIRIGNKVILLAGQRTNRVGMTSPVLLETFGEGRIEIGDYTGASSIVISSRSLVRIGNHVKLGGNVRIFDHDYHSMKAEVRRTYEDVQHVKSAPVQIGDDVFVGTNAMILKGVSIGDRSIIGAGSVVTHDVPSDEVWAGNPAKCIKQLMTTD